MCNPIDMLHKYKGKFSIYTEYNNQFQWNALNKAQHNSTKTIRYTLLKHEHPQAINPNRKNQINQ